MKSPAKAAKVHGFEAAASEARLAQPATLATALTEATAAGSAAFKLAPAIEELVRKGLPPDLAIAAIRALGAIGAPSSSPVIAPLLQHRQPDVRKAAALALAHTRGPHAGAALLRGLRESDPVVRALSASGLASAGDAASVPDLLRALDHNLTEAAPSIGALCAGPACAELLARFDKLPPEVQRATFETMLQRKPALADDVLLLALHRTAAAAGPSKRAWLQGLKTTFKGSKPVQRALEAALRATKESTP